MEFDFALRAFLVALDEKLGWLQRSGKEFQNKNQNGRYGGWSPETGYNPLCGFDKPGARQTAEALEGSSAREWIECYRQLAEQATPQRRVRTTPKHLAIPLQRRQRWQRTYSDWTILSRNTKEQAVESKSMTMCWLEYCSNMHQPRSETGCWYTWRKTPLPSGAWSSQELGCSDIQVVWKHWLLPKTSWRRHRKRYLWKWTAWRNVENRKERAKRVTEKARTPKQKEKAGTASQACGTTSPKEKERAKERARTALTTKKIKRKRKAGKRNLFLPGKPGHRQTDCWKRQEDEGKGVRQVDQPGSGTQLSAARSTVSSTTAGPSASQIRRIDLIDPANCCLIYAFADKEDNGGAGHCIQW